MPAVRQELRPAMQNFAAVRIECRRWRRRTARRGDSHQRTRLEWREYNRARLAPRPAIPRFLAARRPNIANGFCDPARDRDLLHLLVRDESDELVIWRPEMLIGYF